VAHGTERVIDDIREHSYQISVIISTFFFCIVYLAPAQNLVFELKFFVSYFIGTQTLESCRHLLTSNILILLGEIKVAMCVGNLRALLV
jgi:hypothetical protein